MRAATAADYSQIDAHLTRFLADAMRCMYPPVVSREAAAELGQVGHIGDSPIPPSLRSSAVRLDHNP